MTHQAQAIVNEAVAQDLIRASDIVKEMLDEEISGESGVVLYVEDVLYALDPAYQYANSKKLQGMVNEWHNLVEFALLGVG